MFTTELVSKSIARGTRGAFVGFAFVALAGMSGCISDTDCGVCDPDKLVLESVSGINYANRKVHLLNEGVSKGKYFIEDIGACVETPEAEDAPRGAEEWCKLSPLVSWQGLEFVFNNLLDPTSVELVRKDPSNPNLFEIYDWKTRIASIEGPITRYNGDYIEQDGEKPDLMARSVNLSCIDNLRAQGIDYSHEVLDANPDICNGFYNADGKDLPLKMQASGTTKSYAGTTDWRAASCAAPDSGPDTCCTVCDYELSVNVAKYGLTSEGGAKRGPGDALQCDPSGNVYEDCAGFVTDVNREAETNRYSYEWNGTVDTFRLPLSDKIRETHPDERPNGIEPDGKPCQTDADCDASLGGDSGAACIGTTPEGLTCDANTADCGEKHCKAEWFVGCADNDDLGVGLCVDRRFKDKGAGACYVATSDFLALEMDGTATSWGPGNRLARCDTGEFPDGNLSADECCQDSLGGTPGACDPLFQPNVAPIGRFDRDRTLPEENRDCYCGDPGNQNPACEAQIDKYCTAPWGRLEKADGSTNEGHYITRFVSKVGGVVYDPSLKGVLYLPGDRGNEPRSLVESCAELATSPDLVEGRNIQDGWRMHDNAFFENYENFDRGMCSGSEYRVVFATDGERIVDKVGNELEGEQTTYVFETPEFHVVPGTGFPTDNLRIGACDDFELRLSNRYDLDPTNLSKIEIVQISRKTSGEDSLGEECETSFRPECWAEDFVVAGGLSCTEDPDEVSADTPPCLIVDVTLQREGAVRVLIDQVKFGAKLKSLSEDPDENFDEGRPITGRYRMRLPGLEGVERFEDLDLDNPDDLAAYNSAFHDVCGMPLITSGGQGYTDFFYDFTIDAPKCKEDADGDTIQLSCDNAPKHANKDQFDQDQDGWGDVIDVCVLTPNSSNTADSDRDGIGNDCDNCRQTTDKYNLDMAMVADPRMWVRNIPFQFDTDQDGIGDVCDNCIPFANCSVFGPSNPHSVGTPVPYEDQGVCQTDNNSDMIGDRCIDPDTAMAFNEPWAAGPVGFEDTDDFDHDGINNFEDYCPRQPVATVNASVDERTVCTADEDCVEGSRCAPTPANDGNRYCNHIDIDNDQVGDACDTCPFESNPMQITDTGMQLDDEDGDFVGAPCETSTSQGCDIRADPRPYAFMDVAVEGQCCTTTYPGDGFYGPDGKCEGLCDPDGFPIQVDCQDVADLATDVPGGTKCRKLPNRVASRPGVVVLPDGCEVALAAAGKCDGNDPDCPEDMANKRLQLNDVPDEDELWSKMCFLPQWDQDYDDIGDACDLCPFAYDPNNEPYVDDTTGKLWDTFGKYCAGQYSPDAICAAEDEGETDSGTGGETGGTGG